MNTLRGLVRKKKRRHKDGKYDLDLTYITGRIVAMGFPSIKAEGLYRNPMSKVQKFLKDRHDGHHKIYNLCAERSYDHDKFEGDVCHMGFMDHNPPTMQMLYDICADIDDYLWEHPENTVFIHCKAGKGRTGVVICAYLIYCGYWDDPDECMSFYGIARTQDQQGVTIPSQRRFIRYFARLPHASRRKAQGRMGLNVDLPVSKGRKVRRSSIAGGVVHPRNVNCEVDEEEEEEELLPEEPSDPTANNQEAAPCADDFSDSEDTAMSQVSTPEEGKRTEPLVSALAALDLTRPATPEASAPSLLPPHHLAAPTHPLFLRSVTLFGPPNKSFVKGLRLAGRDFGNNQLFETTTFSKGEKINGTKTVQLRNLCLPVNDEVKFMVTRKGKKLMHFWLHTAYVGSGQLTLTKPEIDGARKDTSHSVYPNSLAIILNFTSTATAPPPPMMPPPPMVEARFNGEDTAEGKRKTVEEAQRAPSKPEVHFVATVSESSKEEVEVVEAEKPVAPAAPTSLPAEVVEEPVSDDSAAAETVVAYEKDPTASVSSAFSSVASDFSSGEE